MSTPHAAAPAKLEQVGTVLRGNWDGLAAELEQVGTVLRGSWDAGTAGRQEGGKGAAPELTQVDTGSAAAAEAREFPEVNGKKGGPIPAPVAVVAPEFVEVRTKKPARAAELQQVAAQTKGAAVAATAEARERWQYASRRAATSRGLARVFWEERADQAAAEMQAIQQTQALATANRGRRRRVA